MNPWLALLLFVSPTKKPKPTLVGSLTFLPKDGFKAIEIRHLIDQSAGEFSSLIMQLEDFRW